MLIAFVMFAEIFKNSYRIYLLADIILAVLLIPLLDLISILITFDLSNIPGGILSMFGIGLLWNLLVFGVPAALSVVFGRFILYRRKAEN